MTYRFASHRSTGTGPRWLGALAERLIAARDNPAQVRRVLNASRVPMVLVDDERRYVDANNPARLAIRLSLGQLRELRIEDLTTSAGLPVLEDAWERLTTTGCVAGPYWVLSPDGGLLEVDYYALANALPNRHAIAFVPAQWPDCELFEDWEPISANQTRPLTPRELQVLELAAEGTTGPMIARELVISGATVRTHFEHVYAKLGVRDRAAAVARAMRLGLIA